MDNFDSDAEISKFIWDFVPKPWDTHDGVDDQPGHAEPISIRVYATYPDEVLKRESVMLILHGTNDELHMVVDAIIADGWEPLTYLDPEECQPAFGCMHLVTFHAGHPGPTELAAALSRLVGIDGSDSLPWVTTISPRRR